MEQRSFNAYHVPAQISINTSTNGVSSQNRIFDESTYEYDKVSSSSSEDAKAEQEKAYDYIPQPSQEDEYDYESPYWEPADKKAELLGQFRKLKIRNVVQDDIK